MKKTKVIFWVSTVFIFLFEGIMPLSTLLFAPQYTNAGTKPLGYPDYFAVLLVLFKFSGALVLLLPSIPNRLKEWAYAGLTFNLIFALISHAVVDGNIGFVLLPAGIMAILAMSYFTKDRIQSADDRQKESGILMLNRMG
jgi:hypothetical protein